VAESRWVLDTSIAVSWFFTDDPGREQALAVREDLKQRPDRYFVPPLFHAELVHVLARKSARDARFTKEALRLVLRLGIRTLPLSEDALLRTTDWACQGISGYDTTFVALAEDLGGRWLTADERAASVVGDKAAHTVDAWFHNRA
jgi:predicted nucleic acid-binding protein